MKTVWLIQHPTFVRDFTDATKHGKIEVILDQYDAPGKLPVPCLHKIKSKLKDYAFGDYFLWCGGDPAALMLAGIVMKDLNINDVNWLRWEKIKDPRTGEYSDKGFYVPTNFEI